MTGPSIPMLPAYLCHHHRHPLREDRAELSGRRSARRHRRNATKSTNPKPQAQAYEMKLRDLGEEVLDQMARAIELPVIVARQGPVGARWDHCGLAGGRQRLKDAR